MDFPNDRSLEAIAGCQVPEDYRALQALVQEAKGLRAVVTAIEVPPRKRKVECSGDCRTCSYADDCHIPYRNLLGNQDFVPGVKIA